MYVKKSRQVLVLCLLFVTPALAIDLDDPSKPARPAPASRPSAVQAASIARSWISGPQTRQSIDGGDSAFKLELMTYDRPRPLRLWIAEIDTSHPGLEFVVTEPNPETGTDGRKFETLCETTLDFAKRLDLQLAINTSAFGPGRDKRGLPMDIAGLAAHQGDIFSEPAKNYGAMYVARDGRISLNGPPLKRDGVWNVVAGFRMLVDDSACVVSDDVYHSSFGGINPRTAVGADKTGRRLWIVVADGRQKERTLGLTLPELAALFQWLGAWDALNLDGGGSSTLIVKDQNETHEVVNEPINGGRPGNMRQVACNLGIRLHAKAQAPDELASQNNTFTNALSGIIPTTEYNLSAAAKNLRLPHDAQLNPEFQSRLEAIDSELRRQTGIPEDKRAFGVIDLKEPRVAMINGNRMFYGASVPKIAIVLEYLRQHPELVEKPDPVVMHELQQVIKRSNNELAAKYGKLAGLNNIQAMLQSTDYSFYDENQGGGLWCGKFYGLDAPRIGDPLDDLSHAANVRQCLRYYLMMEQNRLGNPAICNRLREIFAASWLDFHDDNFVAGLKGMNLTMFRKNGLLEDWHLDTARVALSDRPVLLAGIVHHPNGPKYLSCMARALITHLQGPAARNSATIPNKPVSHWQTNHHVSQVAPIAPGANWIRIEPTAANNVLRKSRRYVAHLDSRGAATIDWPPASCTAKFNELLLSWNITHGADVSYAVDVAVGKRFDDSWSPWLNIDQSGDARLDEEPTKHFAEGRIDVDYFASEIRFDRFRARIRLLGKPSAESAIEVARLVATTSDTTGLPDSWQPERLQCSPPQRSQYTRRLDVPSRGQFSEPSEIAGRICSPTSLAMVMAYHGRNESTLDVAKACYDPIADIYGNWPQNIAAAFQLGVGGYLTRFNEWTSVQHHVAEGRPVIASIRIKQSGLIKAAPYKTTNGHLIVICGFDKHGNVHVNDPAVSDPKSGMRVYARDELERAWFGGSGGVAYILLPNKAESRAAVEETAHGQ